ncbi:MAG: bile acid:sodium symporter family protein [Haliscomenobacteraceae bacterium CHB4]|nr:Pantothenate precursors transporter PanS [Saprospiraceae bacterium]MCE7925029.1 bile acid:sodium symporter family protein [Haliscomenobacteraceae bacterium CHB4]
MKNYRFTIAVVISVIAAMAFPQYFTEINGYPLKRLIVPLLQAIMFGMGATMSWQDFVHVVKMPKAVVVGLVCQFSIMPLIGFGLANVFVFPPEIAAGIILIGCSPSGLASNVMSYIAGANVALSITITSLATLMSPVMTPALMKLLAGEFVEIEFLTMMFDIVQMVILPVALGLIVNTLLGERGGWLKRLLPLVSMAGIVVIIAVVTAAGRESLLRIGALLILVLLLHNSLGYLLGYWGARLAGLDEQSCRTVSIEVGLQNAGIASGIALKLGKFATMGVAAAIFGPMMNITGSLLANWWSRKRGR